MAPEAERTEPRSPAREWQWGWAMAVLANLPVPLFFGLFMVSESGVPGVLAGVVTAWLVGHVVIARVTHARRTLVCSGGFFALSQVVPVIQYAAGSVALDLCAGGHPSSLSAATAFLVTVVTAGQLAAAALFCGLLARVCRPLVRVLARLLARHPSRNPS